MHGIAYIGSLCIGILTCQANNVIKIIVRSFFRRNKNPRFLFSGTAMLTTSTSTSHRSMYSHLRSDIKTRSLPAKCADGICHSTYSFIFKHFQERPRRIFHPLSKHGEQVRGLCPFIDVDSRPRCTMRCAGQDSQLKDRIAYNSSRFPSYHKRPQTASKLWYHVSDNHSPKQRRQILNVASLIVILNFIGRMALILPLPMYFCSSSVISFLLGKMRGYTQCCGYPGKDFPSQICWHFKFFKAKMLFSQLKNILRASLQTLRGC